jgi:hypothetical protein
VGDGHQRHWTTAGWPTPQRCGGRMRC